MNFEPWSLPRGIQQVKRWSKKHEIESRYGVRHLPTLQLATKNTQIKVFHLSFWPCTCFCTWGTKLLGFVKQRSRDPDPFWPFCHCFDIMISPSFIAFAAKTIEMYYDVMKYATFSRVLWLALCKTCSFHSILQRNLTFSLLTWLGSPIFLFYLLVRTPNSLWVIFDEIWLIRFFAVVNYMVLKFSFCSNLYTDVIANIVLLHIFINPKIDFNSWNVILKLKSFYSDRHFYNSQETITSRVAINFVDETRYCASINHLDTPL